MAVIPYSAYRILVHASVAGDGAGYCEVAELELFPGNSVDGSSLLTGGEASASSTYGGAYTPDSAFDGSTGSGWSSAYNDVIGSWLGYQLPAQVPVGAMRITASAINHAPSEVTLQGSNDEGVTWTDIRRFTFEYSQIGGIGPYQWVGSVLPYTLAGVAKVSGGGPASAVRVYDWVTGRHIGDAEVSIDGTWEFEAPPASEQYMVVVIGPTGYRPVAHGPLVAEIRL